MTAAFSISFRAARLARAGGRACALLLLAAGAAGIHAQTAAPVDATATTETVAPPGRVGKLGLLSGTVTLVDLQTDEQQPVSLNWPITSGRRLITGPVARAEVRIGSLALRMDGDSTVDFSRVDDELVQIVVQRGSVALRLRGRDLLPDVDLVTPRERIVFDDVGRYRIEVDRTAGITALTTFVGSARIATGQATYTVGSNQRGEIGNAPGVGYTLVAPAPDVFDDWVLARDRRDDAAVSTRYVSPETTGVEALDDYGSWRNEPDYGPVWFPRAVPAGWAPYRYGRWAFVAPWGWTWIDDAPWGFAPFHYGRWALVGGAWCWVPGTWVARPVYAPALVAWYGSPGVSVSVNIGPVGWFPLGPREPYIPPYRYNPRYIVGVNVGHVNIVGGHVAPPPRYMYQTSPGSTWVQNTVIIQRRPVQRSIVAPPPQVNSFGTRPLPPPLLDRPARPAPVPARGNALPGGPRPGLPAGGATVPRPPVNAAVRPGSTPGGTNAGQPGRPPLAQPPSSQPNRPPQMQPPSGQPSAPGGRPGGNVPARPPVTVPPPRVDPVAPATAPRPSAQPRPAQPSTGAPAVREPRPAQQDRTAPAEARNARQGNARAEEGRRPPERNVEQRSERRAEPRSEGGRNEHGERERAERGRNQQRD